MTEQEFYIVVRDQAQTILLDSSLLASGHAFASIDAVIIWFACLLQADNMYGLDKREMAGLLQHGIEPMTYERATEELTQFFEDAVADGCPNPANLLLVAIDEDSEEDLDE